MNADHLKLRTAVDAACDKTTALSLTSVVVNLLDLAELLAAYDALVSAGTKPKKASEYSQEFEEAWQQYPKRPSNNKMAAYKQWKTRLKEGCSAEDMIGGTVNYAAQCRSTGKDGTEFVKQASTFYGPCRYFADDHTISRGLVDRRANQPALQDMRAAASEEAKRRLRGLPPDDGMTIDMVQS